MKRPLTDEELELTEKGIKLRQERIAENETELLYLDEFNAFNDKWKEYLEKKKEKQEADKKKALQMARKNLVDELEFDKQALENEQDQLVNGVEVKEATGVN